MLLGIIGGGQEVLFRGIFPLPEAAGFNRIRYQMLAGTAPNFRATVKRGLVYDRVLFESRPDGFAEVHRLNLYGFRGPDFRIDPPSGGRRVIVVGDSVTEGQGASESETIAARLAREFESEGEEVEVLNLGVVAATLPHLAALVRDATSLLRPTDIVLVLYANDLPAPPYPRELDQPPPRFPRRAVPWWVPRGVELAFRAIRDEPIYRRWPHLPMRFFPAVPDPQNPWSRVSVPPSSLDPVVYRAMVDGALNPWLKEQSDAFPGMLAHDFEANGGSPARYLSRMAAWCQAADANLLVAYVPFCGVIGPRYGPTLVKLGLDPAIAAALPSDPAYRRQNFVLASVCGGLRIPLADATGAIEAADRRRAQYWAYDTHPRPEGYATIAGVIHESLSRERSKSQSR